MIFSHPMVERFTRHFECSWESVREVPKVEVDFGNGTKLRRTILGNVATWFCFADGTAYDVVPGLVTFDEFGRRAEQALLDHRRLVRAADRYEAVRSMHFDRGREGQPVTRVLRTPPRGMVSKRRVEEPLKRAIGGSQAAQGAPDLRKKLVEEPLKHAVRGGSAPYADARKSIVEEPMKRAIAGRSAQRARPDPGKTSVEGPIKGAVGHGSTLEQDSEYNRRVRYPKVSAMFAALARPFTPAQLHERLFREVLGVPLDDPFLGLAPRVLGGEGGRVLGPRSR